MIKNISISTSELAEIYGVSEKYISELVRDHGHPKEDWNKFNLFESIKFWLNYQRDIHRKEIAKLKDEDPQKSLTRTNDKLKQLELEKKIGSLLPLEMAKYSWVEETKIISKALDVIPLKVSPRIPPEVRELVIKILIEEIDEVRYRISSMPAFDKNPEIKTKEVNDV